MGLLMVLWEIIRLKWILCWINKDLFYYYLLLKNSDIFLIEIKKIGNI